MLDLLEGILKQHNILYIHLPKCMKTWEAVFIEKINKPNSNTDAIG